MKLALSPNESDETPKMTGTAERKTNRSRREVPRWITRILVVTALSILVVTVVATGMLFYFSAGLPSFGTMADYHPPQVTRFYDRRGRVVAELFDEKRTVVPLDRIPVHVLNAFLAAEDADFYRHGGMNFKGLLRAFWHNLRAGRVVEGGSTITQQVIKTFVLGPERSYTRKIRELLLALRLESNLTKDEILTLYLNQIFFGHQCYGVQEASRFYFGRDVSELSLAEGAMLAALPKSPARYSPVKHSDRALERRNWVLDRMERRRLVSAADGLLAKQEPLRVVGAAPDFYELSPYYVEHCRRLLEERLGRELLYRGGLQVRLAVDADLDRFAQQAVIEGLREVDRRQGYRGPVEHLSVWDLLNLHSSKDGGGTGMVWNLTAAGPGATGNNSWQVRWVAAREGLRVLAPVIGVNGQGKPATATVDLGTIHAKLDLQHAKWARRFSPVGWTAPPASVAELVSPGDLVEVQLESWQPGRAVIMLSQPPLVQGAIAAIDPVDRRVLALVGGSDFRRSPLIRAIQSKRQPGSAFKPFIYAAAIHAGGYTPATILMDSPEVYYSGLLGNTWKPENFERLFLGPVSLRFSLAHSINTVAVKVCSEIGPGAVAEMANLLGIESELGSSPSLALGTYEVTPLELVNAYATFASLGKVGAPVFITDVIQSNGERIDLPEVPLQQAIAPAEAFVMTTLLQDVVEEGTGKKAQTLGRPMAGKTGTTSEQRDGWFVGYSPDLVAGVWVGFDDHSPLGTGWAQGAGTALPIWVRFMEKALEGRPRVDFRAPEGVVFARIDPTNGLLAQPGLAEAALEAFVEGTEPRSVSDRTASELATTRPSTAGRLPEGLFH